MPPDNRLTAALADEALAELDALLPLFADPARREELNRRLADLEALRQIVAPPDDRAGGAGGISPPA